MLDIIDKLISCVASQHCDQHRRSSDGELKRIAELRDVAIRLNSPLTYFQSDDTKFTDARKRRFFLDIERDLETLDNLAWHFLKNEAIPLLKTKHPTRGWTQLFETLNEAKGYRHLARIGCTNIAFIPRSTKMNVRTPDLQGFLLATKVLCEVKTINPSLIESDRRMSGGVGTTLAHLQEGFFRKLTSDIATAASQMLAYDGNTRTRRIVYVVVNFDDNLHEYAAEYQKQIEACLAHAANPGIETVLDIKPPFYSAM